MTWIGIVGTNGAGKSSVCDLLRPMGYAVLSLSDEVRAEASRRGRPWDRDSLTQTGSELKAEKGHAVLAIMAVEKARQMGSDNVVFDSIRHPDELAHLKKNGVYLIGVTASPEVRYARIQSRGKETDRVDFPTFVSQDTREFEGTSSGQHIAACMAACDIVLDNSGSPEDLQHALENALQRRPA
jgi:dephospho-CoA kinase